MRWYNARACEIFNMRSQVRVCYVDVIQFLTDILMGSNFSGIITSTSGCTFLTMFSNCFISCLLPWIGTAIFGDNSIIVASAVAGEHVLAVPTGTNARSADVSFCCQ